LSLIFIALRAAAEVERAKMLRTDPQRELARLEETLRTSGRQMGEAVRGFQDGTREGLAIAEQVGRAVRSAFR
jgi:hypothetical protein